MKLHYCIVETGNFGDDMNAWFWDEAFPGFRDLNVSQTMLGIDSLLWAENLEMFDSILVMGSGAGVGLLPRGSLHHVEFGFVRGPKTAEVFRLPPGAAISDPACLTPRLTSFRSLPGGNGKTIFVPHCGTMSLDLDWLQICDSAGMSLVSPRDESRDVIRSIAGSSLVITESLHGAIIADAFRIPWIPISIAPMFNMFKWQDWAQSLEMELTVMPALSGMKQAYGILAAARHAGRYVLARVRGKPHATIARADGPGRPLERYTLTKDEKGAVRALAQRASFLIERQLIADLRRASKAAPHLSADKVLTARQDGIIDRIDTVRAALGAQRSI